MDDPFKWLFIAVSCIALSMGFAAGMAELSPGSVERAKAVKACVEQNKHEMYQCAKLK